MNQNNAIIAKKKWVFSIIRTVLIFLLLAFAIWFFYELKIRQIESGNKITINK